AGLAPEGPALRRRIFQSVAGTSLNPRTLWLWVVTRFREHIFMSAPALPIEMERLILRSFQRGDAEGLRAYHLLPSMQRYVFSRTRDAAEVDGALEIMRSHVSLQRPGDTLTLAMVRKADRALLGHVSLLWADATAGQGEVRFLINPTYSGQGYASEAISAMFDVAFDHFHIHRVFARSDGRDQHSIKLM